MSPLEKIIRQRIATDGPMSFKDFMATALYEPGFGYYMRAALEIGAKGDFYTSPHLHPAFGAMIARQAEECWRLMDCPEDFHLVEAGSGRGFLALDLLDYLKERDLYQHISYHIVEINSSMATRQRELLDRHAAKITWHQHLSQAGPVRGMIVTNELLDALPVHLVVMQEELKEIHIAIRSDIMVEEPGPLSSKEIPEYLRRFDIELTEGMRTEVHLPMKDWIKEAGKTLEEGFMLTIDYGFPSAQYYSKDRPSGTLLCYHQHTVGEDFLSNIGLQDITAHVNFSALSQWAEEVGLAPLGFTRQGPYLVSLGLDEVVTEMYTAEKGLGRDMPKIQNLIMAGTMGDTHKVMLQCTEKYRDAKPRGFALKNQLSSL